MILSKRGIAVIKNFEGLRLNAYQDIAGVWTIGYGSTMYNDGKPVKPGDKLANEAQTETLLKSTLTNYVNAVNKGASVHLSQDQFDALVSFIYNVGTGAVRSSTLFKKLNAGDYRGAADQFLVWNKITDPHTGKKVVSKTLTQRREQERALFLSE
ncbi:MULTISPECIES: lysozyme [unclassified Mucilaginibacter]|uniref:lysozyme n=1 Tax=unclassified Mucilaginibacter TaxID=2617802 RepID=UPI002AC8ECBB|nr:MULTISPECIES: lysozyme [unclassified Mucilaginibacter]MEB0280621.1 lysozyme [Mucilaginibacter sp. 10B2]MEB0300294.1 lysozyme [Mucilaginibacter sp. 5C4]WPX24961.1 lysozyme [Mucilaginibacter sp. 5C4]